MSARKRQVSRLMGFLLVVEHKNGEAKASPGNRPPEGGIHDRHEVGKQKQKGRGVVHRGPEQIRYESNASCVQAPATRERATHTGCVA